MKSPPSLWERRCVCGHRLRDHRLDWDDPLDGVTPDCRYVTVVRGAERSIAVPCECMEFRFDRRA